MWAPYRLCFLQLIGFTANKLIRPMKAITFIGIIFFESVVWQAFHYWWCGEAVSTAKSWMRRLVNCFLVLISLRSIGTCLQCLTDPSGKKITVWLETILFNIKWYTVKLPLIFSRLVEPFSFSVQWKKLSTQILQSVLDNWLGCFKCRRETNDSRNVFRFSFILGMEYVSS